MSPSILAGYCPATADRSPVDFAAAAARFTGASLHVVSVYTRGEGLDLLVGGESEAAAVADDAPLRFAGEFDDLDVQSRQEIAATPATGLAAAIAELNPSLVVLGSTHRTAVGNVLLGSTADRIVHGAPCPVAVVPRGYTPPPNGLEHVGAAFAPTPEGREALHAAALLARAASARLRAIMVLEPRLVDRQASGMLAHGHHDDVGGEDRTARVRGEAEARLEEAIADLPAGVEVEPDVLFQAPTDGLAEASRQLDVLVMGARAYGPMRAVMLGGVSRAVMQRAACPVIVLPRGAEGNFEVLLDRAARDEAAT